MTGRKIDETLARIRAMGLAARWDSEGGEFRITYRKRDAAELGTTPEDAAYYTDDATDAVLTASVMIGRLRLEQSKRYSTEGGK